MSPKEFDQYFQKNKDTFHNYIDNIKKKTSPGTFILLLTQL